MQWWNDFVDWLSSDEGWRIISGAIIPFLAIIIAGIIAAAIGRGATRRVVTLGERDTRIAAVTTLLVAARRASVWNTLTGGEQQHADQLATEAEIRLRLLAIPGASLASDWTAHEIAEMKKNSVSFSFQAEQSLIVVRDRLIEWQGRPSRARRLFKNDLDSWAYESSLSDQDLIHQQQAWAAQQSATSPATTVKTSSAATEHLPVASEPLVSEPAAGLATAALATSEPIATLSGPAAPSPFNSGPANAESTDAVPTEAEPATTESTDTVSTDTSPVTPAAPAPLVPDDSIFARPVTASDVSKRINPLQDDITP